MPTTLSADDIRIGIGLSKTQWDSLAGKRTPRQVATAWEKFKRNASRALDYEFASPSFYLEDVPYITTIQAARALGVGEFHLANLQDRDKLQGTKHGRRIIYSRENLDALLSPPEDGRRGALAGSFIRWLTLNED